MFLGESFRPLNKVSLLFRDKILLDKVSFLAKKLGKMGYSIAPLHHSTQWLRHFSFFLLGKEDGKLDLLL